MTDDAIREAVASAIEERIRSGAASPWITTLSQELASVATFAYETAQAKAAAPFQSRVADWMAACFTPEICADKIERNHRFLEEALELVQSLGCTASEAHQLVDYTYGRPQGEVNQEVGGVMVTLAALCLASGLDMTGAGEAELVRVWTKIDQIRAKQAAKPKNSPLPEVAAPADSEPTKMSPFGASREAWEAAALVCREVAELPDRTSPEDNPDMMLVDADELAPIVAVALDAFAARKVAEAQRRRHPQLHLK